MKPECAAYIDKARSQLSSARNLVRDGYANEAGRATYLATFNAAQAYIYDHTGKAAKTHAGVRSQFAQLSTLEPRIGADMTTFLSDAFNMKKVADYELGPDALLPMDRVMSAIAKATAFVERLSELLDAGAPQPRA